MECFESLKGDKILKHRKIYLYKAKQHILSFIYLDLINKLKLFLKRRFILFSFNTPFTFKDVFRSAVAETVQHDIGNCRLF